MVLQRFVIEFYHLGSDWQIVYFADEEAVGLLETLLVHVDHFCDVFSRFDVNSMLSRLNELRSLEVSKEFVRLFEVASFYYEKTDGIFNPLATPAHFGYTKDFETGEFGEVNVGEINLDWKKIERIGEKITLAPGQILDFGGIGKGYLIDEIADVMRLHSGHFMINGGGDIWVEGGKPDGSPWGIAIEDFSESDNEEFHVVDKFIGAVATSGTSRRHWNSYHHLIDVSSKSPAKNIPLSLTVMANSACLADVAATTLICSHSDEYEKIAATLDIQYGYFQGRRFVSSPDFSLRT